MEGGRGKGDSFGLDGRVMSRGESESISCSDRVVVYMI